MYSAEIKCVLITVDLWPLTLTPSGHILDDQDLVDTLEKSKKMSGEIQKRVGESEVTQKKIEQARKKYLPVSTGAKNLLL